jgi:hypothetical protein
LGVDVSFDGESDSGAEINVGVEHPIEVLRVELQRIMRIILTLSIFGFFLLVIATIRGFFLDALCGVKVHPTSVIAFRNRVTIVSGSIMSRAASRTSIVATLDC